MPQLTPDAQRLISDLAARYEVSPDAVLTLVRAVQTGGGRQAQFSHPDLGGLGQWSRGGLTMIGDMFNSALKARVEGLCTEIAAWLDRTPEGVAGAGHVPTSQTQRQSWSRSGAGLSGTSTGTNWWPAALGTPSSVGAQNDLRYACFPATRRLAISHSGRIRIYDTGEHQILGVSQQQGLDQSLTFTSQHGLVRLADLPQIASENEDRSPELPNPEPSIPPEGAPAPVGQALSPDRRDQTNTSADEILVLIERLAELRRKDILTEEEFTAKKAELLARL